MALVVTSHLGAIVTFGTYAEETDASAALKMIEEELRKGGVNKNSMK